MEMEDRTAEYEVTEKNVLKRMNAENPISTIIHKPKVTRKVDVPSKILMKTVPVPPQRLVQVDRAIEEQEEEVEILPPPPKRVKKVVVVEEQVVEETPVPAEDPVLKGPPGGGFFTEGHIAASVRENAFQKKVDGPPKPVYAPEDIRNPAAIEILFSESLKEINALEVQQSYPANNYSDIRLKATDVKVVVQKMMKNADGEVKWSPVGYGSVHLGTDPMSIISLKKPKFNQTSYFVAKTYSDQLGVTLPSGETTDLRLDPTPFLYKPCPNMDSESLQPMSKKPKKSE